MLNKKLIIEMLNDDIKEYQHYKKLYETTKDFRDKMLHWDKLFTVSVSLNARKQMCKLFGYHIVCDESEKVVDIVEV